MTNSTLESTSPVTQAARPLKLQPEPVAASSLSLAPHQNLLLYRQMGAVFLNVYVSPKSEEVYPVLDL